MAKSQEASKKALEEVTEEINAKRQDPEVPDSREPEHPPWEEKYYEVVFSERGSKEDTVNVTLGVNGEWLVIERGTPVIIPGRFLEGADHTKSADYSLEENTPLYISSYSQTFRYTKMRDATKEEWEKFLRDGNKITKEKMNQASSGTSLR